jgi:hypothetical protein
MNKDCQLEMCNVLSLYRSGTLQNLIEVTQDFKIYIYICFGLSRPEVGFNLRRLCSLNTKGINFKVSQHE